MRYIAILVLTLLLVPFTFADIGPSPSYSFSISNAEEYPNYGFFYSGNIWPEKLEQVNSETSVYKLNTHIIIYAIPTSVADSETNFEKIVAQSVASQSIDLSSGKTVFKVASFDPPSGVMALEVQNNIPDTDFGNWGIDLILFAGIAAIIIVIAAVAFFLLKKGHNK